MLDARGAALAVLTGLLLPAPCLAAPVPPAPSLQTPAAPVERQAMLLKSVPTQKKLIAFTFDDGPNRRYTPQVLSLLHQYKAHATFFVIGQEVVRFPEMVQKIQAAGMELGNHGMNHKYLNKLTPDEAQQEITGGGDAIVGAGGKAPYLYRLPGGFSSDSSGKVLGKLGYTVIGWSVDTRDWRRSITPERIERTVMREAAPGKIVIMHDGSVHREATLAALGKVLPQLESQGYEIVSIGTLLRQSDYAALRKLPPQTCQKKAKPKPATPQRPARTGWLRRLLPGTRPGGQAK